MTQKQRYKLEAISLFLCMLFFMACAPRVLSAEHQEKNHAAVGKEEKGEVELRICTQNIHNLGMKKKQTKSRKKKRTPQEGTQAKYLAARIMEARCDVVAVQEVWGEDLHEAKRSLQILVNALANAGAIFVPIVGEGPERPIRNGFLIRKNSAELLDTAIFPTENVPKLSLLKPAQRYPRSPLQVTLRVLGRENKPTRRVVLLTMHFKSKVDGWRDPTQTLYEAFRMEMAEGLRTIAERELEKSPESIVILLGDQNNDEQSATAAILRGDKLLLDFQEGGACKLDERHLPRCDKSVMHEPKFVALLEEAYRKGARYGDVATYLYRGELSIIDNIYVSPQCLWMFHRSDGGVAVGVKGNFRRGSDHKLVWTELNW